MIGNWIGTPVGGVFVSAAAEGIAAATGTSAVSGVGAALYAATGAAAGTSAVAATGNADIAAIGSATGTATVVAIGQTTKKSPGTVSENGSTVTGIGTYKTGITRSASLTDVAALSTVTLHDLPAPAKLKAA